MTYLQLCQRVRREMGYAGGTSPSTVVGQTGQMLLVVEAVAKADVEIQMKWPNWSFLWAEATITTVANQRAYTTGATGWPADLGRWDANLFMLAPDTDDAQALLRLDYRTWVRDYRTGAPLSDKPQFVVVKPSLDLILEPRPDDAYSLYAPYWIAPSRMDADADVSAIPAQFHDVIVARAKMMLAEIDEAMTIYQSAKLDFDAWMMRLEAHSLPHAEADTGYNESNDPLVVQVE